MTTTTTKICRVCGKEKPISEFYTNANYKDGHFNNCKECHNKASIEARHKRNKRSSTDSPLSNFTPRELIEELRARGYKGTLTFTKQIVL